MTDTTVTVIEDEILIVEVAQQGPPGAAGVDGNSGYTAEFVATGVTEIIPARHQKLIYGRYAVEGVLDVEGKMVLL